MKRSLLAGVALLLSVVVALAMAPVAFAGPQDFTKLRAAFIVKATDSDFWQVVFAGARKAAKDFGIQVDYLGATSEADVDRQVAILENAITKRPDIIVIAPTAAVPLVPGIEKAYNSGIATIVIDSSAKTDQYHSFLASDNYAGGQLAADQLAAAIQKRYGKVEGKIAVLTAMAGVGSLTERDNGFMDRVKEKYPKLRIVAQRYADNDIARALNNTLEIVTAHPDLVGIFADNNHMGDGASRAISEQNLAKKVALVAFDADPEEINQLKAGNIDALIVQDPYMMGYAGVAYGVLVHLGVRVPKFLDTGLIAVTRDNFNTEAIQGLLYPEKRKMGF